MSRAGSPQRWRDLGLAFSIALMNTTALMAQCSSDLRKAGIVVRLQPVRVRRTPRDRRLALSLLTSVVVGAAFIASATILISSFTPGTPVGYAGFGLRSCQTIFHFHMVPRAIANTFLLAGLAVVLDVLPYAGPWATMSVAIFREVFGNHFGTASASILIAAAFVPLFLTCRVLGERAALGM